MNDPLRHTKVRPQANRSAHLAVRGIPKYLSEEEIRDEMVFHYEFGKFHDTEACKLKRFDDGNEKRKTVTWRFSVPKEIAKD